jgi:hypothetical protein
MRTGWLVLANNYFGVGLLRGLNSVAEVFAPYSSEHERSLPRADALRLEQAGGGSRRCGSALAHGREETDTSYRGCEAGAVSRVVIGGGSSGCRRSGESVPRPLASVCRARRSSGAGCRSGAHSGAEREKRKTGTPLVLTAQMRAKLELAHGRSRAGVRCFTLRSKTDGLQPSTGKERGRRSAAKNRGSRGI